MGSVIALTYRLRRTLAELVYGGALELFQSTMAKPRTEIAKTVHSSASLSERG